MASSLYGPERLLWLKGLVAVIYAALGDSITHGYSSTNESKRFVHRIKVALSTTQRVNVFTQAKPGWTSKQLLNSLSTVPTCIWDEAKVITIMVGGNDLLRQSPWLLHGDATRSLKVADRLRENLTNIVHLIRRPQSLILMATIYNPFPNALLAAECTSNLNKSIHLVATRENIMLVDIHEAFSGHEYTWIDGYRRGEMRDFKIRNNPVHPNDKGHQQIASAFVKAYRQAIFNRNRLKRTLKNRNSLKQRYRRF